MGKLSFISDFKSVEEFNDIELPDFTVITGKNGSGKTHLLQAIQQGKDRYVSIGKERTFLFSQSNFRVHELAASNSHNQSQNNRLNQDWRNLESIMQGKESIDDARNINIKYTIRRIMEQMNYDDIGQIVPEDFYNLRGTEYQNILQSNFSRIFLDYQKKREENRKLTWYNHEYNTSYSVLSEDDFLKINGKEPWIEINNILKNFGTIDYEVIYPDLNLPFKQNFTAKLRHISKGIEINFQELSSGEHIIMSLMVAIYNARFLGLPISLLLLDEIDASLHPEMIETVLNIITNLFVKEYGLKIIMTTHSPSTVALSPEESIYVMHKFGKNRIEKQSRQEAIQTLTNGYYSLDDGILLINEITRHKVTIITEGYNTKYIKKALELYKIQNVHVLEKIVAQGFFHEN